MVDSDDVWTPPVTVPAPVSSDELDELWTPRERYRPTTPTMRALAAIPDAQARWRPSSEEWTCAYGCRGWITKSVPTRMYHVWDCPWWWHEGRSAAPF